VAPMPFFMPSLRKRFFFHLLFFGKNRGKGAKKEKVPPSFGVTPGEKKGKSPRLPSRRGLSEGSNG